MFVLPKLVLFVFAVAVVWAGYRWVSGYPRHLARRRPVPARPAIHAEDLVACGVCGAYIAAGSPGCGRVDCPRPR
jgi:hypothetical protein